MENDLRVSGQMAGTGFEGTFQIYNEVLEETFKFSAFQGEDPLFQFGFIICLCQRTFICLNGNSEGDSLQRGGVPGTGATRPADPLEAAALFTILLYLDLLAPEWEEGPQNQVLWKAGEMKQVEVSQGGQIISIKILDKYE